MKKPTRGVEREEMGVRSFKTSSTLHIQQSATAAASQIVLSKLTEGKSL